MAKQKGKNRLIQIVGIVLLLAFGATYILKVFPSDKYSKREQNKIQKVNIDFTKQGELSILDSLNNELAKFDIEIADTDFKTQQGLMYRSSMAANQGMLFVFEKEAMKSFWMRNTQIALDLIYADKDQKIVSIWKNAKPFDDKTSLSSKYPAQYVFEINAGLSDKLGLAPGQKMEWKRIDGGVE